MDQEITCELCNMPCSTNGICGECRRDVVESEPEWETNGNSPWLGLV